MGSQCCLSTGLVANGIRLTKRCNSLSSRSDITRGLPDLGKSFTLLVKLMLGIDYWRFYFLKEKVSEGRIPEFFGSA
jgi:hypothetical protein